MSKKTLVFDAGGSKTSFAATDVEGIFEGKSLHPRRFLEIEADELLEWKHLLEPFQGYEVVFYGAGCGAAESRGKVRDFLQEYRFSEITVYPDTLGACRALWGNQSGVAAILGTGSVCMEYDGSEIISRSGGFGPLVGDEGSGFYFGKLFVRYLLQRHPNLSEQIFNRFSNEQIYAILTGSNAIQGLAQFSKETQGLDLDWIHHENLKLFCQLYLPDLPLEKRKLGVVGGYGCAHSGILREICAEIGWELVREIEKPIVQLLDYHKQNH